MRADLYLFVNGYAKSRQSAKLLIEGEMVLLDGEKIKKASFDVDEEAKHTVEVLTEQRFVSRGGEKLDFALEAFKIDVKGISAIDIGASTGGFTDCLLQRGAKIVYAVDAGHSQLDPSLLCDERVINIEKYNARLMTKEDFPISLDLAVMDVSFISQCLIHNGINSVLKDGGVLVSLIKPQFEAGRAALNKKGVVKSATDRARAIENVIESAVVCGFSAIDLVCSPIEGGSGNVEYLALFKKSDSPENHISKEKIKAISNKK